MKTANMAIMSVALLGVGLFGITSVSFDDVSQNNSIASDETGAILGHLTAIHKDASGNILAYSQSDNVVVNEGRANMAFKTFGSLNVTGLAADETFNVIALLDESAGPTPAAGDSYDATDLWNTNGLEPSEITKNDGTAGTNCTGDEYLGSQTDGDTWLGCTFTATGDGNKVFGAAIINNGTADTLFAHKNFTGTSGSDGITLNTNDQLTILWDIAWTNS